jgi:hypothetical protein
MEAHIVVQSNHTQFRTVNANTLNDNTLNDKGSPGLMLLIRIIQTFIVLGFVLALIELIPSLVIPPRRVIHVRRNGRVIPVYAREGFIRRVLRHIRITDVRVLLDASAMALAVGYLIVEIIDWGMSGTG